MSEQMTTLTEETFKGYVKENDCTIVFYKSKCPNCKVLLKVMEKCKVSNSEMIMGHINSEENKTVADELDVSRVPTVLVYKNGELKARKTGIMKPVEMEALYMNA